MDDPRISNGAWLRLRKRDLKDAKRALILVSEEGIRIWIVHHSGLITDL